MISLILSTPVLLAASISITSNEFPFVMALQGPHLLQISYVGSLLSLPSQLNALAIILAVVVFPPPLLSKKMNYKVQNEVIN
jgi:hypothetical protein